MPTGTNAELAKYQQAWKALNILLKYGNQEVQTLAPVVKKIEQDYEIPATE